MNKIQVNQLATTLREHLRGVARDTFAAAQILTAFKQQRLYEIIGFDSFAEFVEDTGITASVGQAHTYVYEHAKRLKYTKVETIEIIESFGLHQSARLLSQQDRKVALSTLQRKSVAYAREHNQVNFVLAPDELRLLEDTLAAHGMYYTETGTRMNKTEALVRLLKTLPAKLRAVA